MRTDSPKIATLIVQLSSPADRAAPEAAVDFEIAVLPTCPPTWPNRPASPLLEFEAIAELCELEDEDEVEDVIAGRADSMGEGALSGGGMETEKVEAVGR